MGNQPQLERAELEAVLQSGIFSRAPNLASFLQYVCERYLEGRADQIKEYSIAVEALGRSPEFDQKKDSIVRVEAHKLRKRLAEYYAGPGAGHPMHIVIPNGQYAPQFVPADHGDPLVTSVEIGPLERSIEVVPAKIDLPGITPTAFPSNGLGARKRLAIAYVVAVCGIILGILVWRAHSPKRTASPTDEVWAGTAAQPLPSEVRMLAGYHGPPFRDRQGRTWSADAYFTGGRSIPVRTAVPIQAQPDSGFVRSKRQGKFRYDIPLRTGVYELHLMFAETDYGMGNPAGGAESDHLFRISINDKLRADTFDVIAQAGAANRLHDQIFKDITPSQDGKLHLRFDPISGAAFLNGLEILPTLPGKMRPIRIVTQETSVTDEEGQVWAADQYVIGGRMVIRHDSVTNVREKSIYDGERYGNFTYRIPLAPGKYRLTLHFAETYFGTPQTTYPAVGSRSFNVFANGTALLRGFDIAKEAGGANRAIEKTFDDLEPNAQGELVLEFVPILNYACVNAIEVTETE
ncbi:MAG: malectin domain-containing carbohydrate-binding protein [Bryobacteraceae bacterium]